MMISTPEFLRCLSSPPDSKMAHSPKRMPVSEQKVVRCKGMNVLLINRVAKRKNLVLPLYPNCTTMIGPCSTSNSSGSPCSGNNCSRNTLAEEVDCEKNVQDLGSSDMGAPIEVCRRRHLPKQLTGKRFAHRRRRCATSGQQISSLTAPKASSAIRFRRQGSHTFARLTPTLILLAVASILLILEMAAHSPVEGR